MISFSLPLINSHNISKYLTHTRLYKVIWKKKQFSNLEEYINEETRHPKQPLPPQRSRKTVTWHLAILQRIFGRNMKNSWFFLWAYMNLIFHQMWFQIPTRMLHVFPTSHSSASHHTHSVKNNRVTINFPSPLHDIVTLIALVSKPPKFFLKFSIQSHTQMWLNFGRTLTTLVDFF